LLSARTSYLGAKAKGIREGQSAEMLALTDEEGFRKAQAIGMIEKQGIVEEAAALNTSEGGATTATQKAREIAERIPQAELHLGEQPMGAAEIEAYESAKVNVAKKITDLTRDAETAAGAGDERTFNLLAQQLQVAQDQKRVLDELVKAKTDKEGKIIGYSMVGNDRGMVKLGDLYTISETMWKGKGDQLRAGVEFAKGYQVPELGKSRIPAESELIRLYSARQLYVNNPFHDQNRQDLNGYFRMSPASFEASMASTNPEWVVQANSVKLDRRREMIGFSGEMQSNPTAGLEHAITALTRTLKSKDMAVTYNDRKSIQNFVTEYEHGKTWDRSGSGAVSPRPGLFSPQQLVQKYKNLMESISTPLGGRRPQGNQLPNVLIEEVEEEEEA